MTKAAAIYNFFLQFGLPVYEENSVYSEENAPDFPYLTYENKADFFNRHDVTISFDLWYRSTSWVTANAKSQEISAAIGRTGTRILCDDGYILIMRQSPWAQNMGDPSDDMVERINHSLKIRFYTND